MKSFMVRTLALLTMAVAIFALASPDSAAAEQQSVTTTPGDSSVSLHYPATIIPGVFHAYRIAWRRNNDDSHSWHGYRTWERNVTIHGLINGAEYEFVVLPIVQPPTLEVDLRYFRDVVAPNFNETALATPNGPVLQPPALTAMPGAEPGSVDLSWTATPDAKSYTYQYKAKDASWHVDGEIPSPLTSSLKTKVTGDTTTATIENLAPGTEYTFRIHVKAGIRKSDWYETDVWSKTVKPTIHSAVAASRQVELKWNDVPGATGYAYQYRAGQSGNWSAETSVAAEPRSVTISGLNNNTEYTFRVRSTGHGAPPWSDPVYATPSVPNDSPSAPAQADVNPGTTAALFTWQSGGNGVNGTCPTDSFEVSITDALNAPISGSPYQVGSMSNSSYVYRLYVDQGLNPNESYTALITPYGCNTTGENAELTFDMDGVTEPLRFEELEGSEQMQPPFRVKNLDVKTVGFKAIATWAKPKTNEEGRCPLEDNVEYRWHLENLQTGDPTEGNFESDADPVELALDKMKKGYEYRLMVKAYSPRCDQESKTKRVKWLQPDSKGKRVIATSTAESN